MPSKFVASYEGIGEMLRADFMAAHMIGRAQRVAAFAESRAPVYAGTDRDPHRGRYKESFHVLGTRTGGWKHDRAAAIVINDAPEAVFVEYGTREHTAVVHERDGRSRTVVIPAMPARHILAEALMSAAGDE